MSDSLIWLHEDALRADHPVFRAAPMEMRAIYIWDDAYFRQMDYSLKRLVFLYETLCELPIEIVAGDTLEILRVASESHVFVPATLNPLLRSIANQLSADKSVTIVEDEPFVVLSEQRDFVRFAQYWKRAQKSAVLWNGGVDA